MSETDGAQPFQFDQDRISSFFEQVREYMPHQQIPVDEDMDGAIALVNVLVYAHPRPAGGRSVLGFQIANYLEGLSPDAMAARAFELKRQLKLEGGISKVAHLAIDACAPPDSPRSIEKLTDNAARFLAGHLKNRRYGRDLKLPRPRTVPEAPYLMHRQPKAQLAWRRNMLRDISGYGSV